MNVRNVRVHVASKKLPMNMTHRITVTSIGQHIVCSQIKILKVLLIWISRDVFSIVCPSGPSDGPYARCMSHGMIVEAGSVQETQYDGYFSQGLTTRNVGCDQEVHAW